MSDISRRDLLMYGLGASLLSSPIQIFLDGLVAGIVNKALAQENSFKGKYVLIQQSGAPPRWMFDQFLAPYGGEIVRNLSVGSEFSGTSVYNDAVYKTHSVKGIQAPIVWTHDVASSSGGSRPLSDLLDNLLSFQGVDALNAGHGPAMGLLNRPLSRLSIDGIVSDHSALPFASLVLGGNQLEFRSDSGKVANNFSSGEDYVKKISESFDSKNLKVRENYAAELDRAVASLDSMMASSKKGGAVLESNRKGARELIYNEIAKLQAGYPALVSKYESIIDNTLGMSNNLKGFTDKPIGKSGNRNGDEKYRRNGDSFVGDADMRNTLTGMRVGNMARKFAMAEYALVNGWTSSVSLGADNSSFTIDGRRMGITNDQHSIGAMVSVLYTTINYRVLAACMLGLVDALKAKSEGDGTMFDNTVIRLNGEFGRYPKENGGGSDHSAQSQVATLISGMVDGPTIAGAIRKDGAAARRRGGSWGLGAEMKNGQHTNTTHVVSTIASMLNIPSPSPNAPSLIKKDEAGKVELNTSYIEKTKVES